MNLTPEQFTKLIICTAVVVSFWIVFFVQPTPTTRRGTMADRSRLKFRDLLKCIKRADESVLWYYYTLIRQFHAEYRNHIDDVRLRYYCGELHAAWQNRRSKIAKTYLRDDPHEAESIMSELKVV